MKKAITELDGATNMSNSDVFGFFCDGGKSAGKLLSRRSMSTREMRRKAERQARRKRKK